jgi:hypothetical protein
MNYKFGILDNLLLSPHANVRWAAHRIDLNKSILKYNLIFFHNNLNILLDRLEEGLKEKTEPILKSKKVRLIVQSIMRLILRYEQVCSFFNRKIPKKLQLGLKTILFLGSFSFNFFLS